jgi:exodeoxyribonuclease V gamma subunit
VTVGRARRSVQRYKQLTVVRIPPLPGTPEERRAAALAELAVLLDLYDRGMREPLPLYCETSAAFAAFPVDQRSSALRAASAAWTTEFGEAAREDADPDHVRVLGGIRAFDELLDEAPRPDEASEAWGGEEPTRLGRYAHRLWARLLDVEEVSDR